jgi:hypothetical protein
MKRLLMMLGYQVLLPTLAGGVLGAAIFAAMSWDVTKAVLLGAMPSLVLVGTAIGYVKGRPSTSNDGDHPGRRAARGLAGSMLGLVVFSTVAMALGSLGLYAYGLLGHETWFSLIEEWLPAVGTAGGGFGLVAGYAMAH